MSRIQTVGLNYQQKRPNKNQNKSQAGQNPSFGVAPSEFSGASKKVYELCEKKTVGWFTQFGEFLAKNDSEIEKQVINAVFTATLAPLVIGYNPFSHQDEKTKKYMALRQPISAGVAIAGGIAMTKPIDDFLAKIASEGCIPTLDMRVVPDKDYLKSYFNADFKKAADKQKFLDELGVPKVESGFFKKIRYEKACEDKYVENMQNGIKKTFISLIGENPENIVLKDEKGEGSLINKVISVITKDEDGNIISTKEIGRNIPNMNSQEQLHEYLGKNNLHKQTFGDFLKENLKFEFYEDGKLKPGSLENKLKEVKAMDFLEKMGIKGFDEEELNRVMGRMNQSKSKANSSKINELIEAMQRMTARATQRSNGGTKNYTITLEQLFHHMGYVEGKSNKCCTEKIQQLMDSKVSEVVEILKNGSMLTIEKPNLGSVHGLAELILDSEKEKIFKDKSMIDLAENIMATKISRLGTKFKAYKGYVGIISNLVIVVITCTALNWIYPRLVEALFPSLVKDDAPKGGHK